MTSVYLSTTATVDLLGSCCPAVCCLPEYKAAAAVLLLLLVLLLESRQPVMSLFDIIR